jgi:hypothetical protein
MDYTVTLTDAEDKALSYIAASQQEWIDNAVHERCRLAVDEIVQLTVQKCLDNSIQIPGSKDEMVELAFEQGWIKSAADRNADAIAAPQV